jgi:hypothetical protein
VGRIRFNPLPGRDRQIKMNPLDANSRLKTLSPRGCLLQVWEARLEPWRRQIEKSANLAAFSLSMGVVRVGIISFVLLAVNLRFSNQFALAWLRS